MASSIQFRSHLTGRDRSDDVTGYTKQRGSSWSHLRKYQSSDDIRDIAWKKVTPEWIFIREREDRSNLNIIFYDESSSYDDFFIYDPSESKKYYKELLRKKIQESALQWKHSYREYSGENALKNLIHEKLSDHLIFICNREITPEIERLAFHNDLIYIDLYNPYEANPDIDLMFSGKLLNVKKYLEEYQKQKNALKKKVVKMWASFLAISTKDDIIRSFNTFFKNRFTNG